MQKADLSSCGLTQVQYLKQVKNSYSSRHAVTYIDTATE